MSSPFKWAEHGGYEVSSKGDKRFSAFNAMMPDRRTIEMHYQCDVKGYDPGGKKWWRGKGRKPLNKATDLWAEYLKLWRIWAARNPALMQSLAVSAMKHNNTLTDMFATPPVNQAHALCVLLNEQFEESESLL